MKVMCYVFLNFQLRAFLQSISSFYSK